MVYLVTYDLNRPGQDYAGLHTAIKALGAWWHYLDSTWLVDTHLSAQQISDNLVPTIDSNDRLLAIGVTSDYQGWLTEDAWKWINERMRRAA